MPAATQTAAEQSEMMDLEKQLEKLGPLDVSHEADSSLDTSPSAKDTLMIKDL